MDEALLAHTPNEMEYYLRVTACAHCGGPLVPQEPEPAGQGASADGVAGRATVRVRCRKCHRGRTYRFAWQFDTSARPDAHDCINPSDQPSRIVDLVQWMGLYYQFSEAADGAASPAEARRDARRAALCLEEALKFHAGEEQPPETALFCEASLTAYRDSPANYARSRLQELQARLPAAARPEADEPPGDQNRSWWRFWKHGAK
jgi:hypothetical protein